MNLVVFTAAFRLLTTASVGLRSLAPGIAIAAVARELLQLLGGWYVSREARNATPVYGTLALVIGLLAWIHLGAFFTVLGAEANVVLERRLWPRSLLPDGDRVTVVWTVAAGPGPRGFPPGTTRFPLG